MTTDRGRGIPQERSMSDRTKEGESLFSDAPVKGWFTVEAGVGVRGQLRREIEKAAWERGLDVEVEESKGFLESVYRFTVRGEGNKVKRFIADMTKWMREMDV